jgi:hypothetical protein
MKTLVLTALIAFAFCSLQTDNYIPWKESRRLTWNDFKGKPDEKSPFKAKTESNLDIQISTKGEEATLTMVTSFDMNKSWVKDKRDVLLRHEQTHFDIAELWSRKFKQRLKGKTFAAKSFQSILSSMHADIQKEGRAMQAQYDKETEHSINEKAQAKWTQKINADLKSLSEFTPATVTCKLSK